MDRNEGYPKGFFDVGNRLERIDPGDIIVPQNIGSKRVEIGGRRGVVVDDGGKTLAFKIKFSGIKHPVTCSKSSKYKLVSIASAGSLKVGMTNK